MRTLISTLALVAFLFAIPAHGAEEFYIGMSGNDELAMLEFDVVVTPLAPSIDLLPEGNYPYDVTMLPDASEVWICGAVGDGIVVVETATHTLLTTIDLSAIGEYPVNIAFNPAGTLAYVSSRDSDAVVLVDVATHLPTGETVSIPAGPGKGRVRVSDGTIFVVDWYGDYIHAINPGSLAVVSADIGSSLWDLAIHPSGSPLYAIDRGTDQVHVVDPDSLTVTTSVAVGDDPWGIDITPDGTTLFIANEDSSDVTVIETATNTVLTTIDLDVGAAPRDVDITADGSFVVVLTGDVTGDDGIYIIDAVMLIPQLGVSWAGAMNSNAVAVAPEPLGGFIFRDGFEYGDTTGWTSSVP